MIDIVQGRYETSQAAGQFDRAWLGGTKSAIPLFRFLSQPVLRDHFDEHHSSNYFDPLAAGSGARVALQSILGLWPKRLIGHGVDYRDHPHIARANLSRWAVWPSAIRNRL